MFDVVVGTTTGLLVGLVFVLYFTLAELEEKLAALQRKESVSNRSRIAACKALEDLISSRCADMEKHIETYQDINKKKVKNLCLSQGAMSDRIDDGVKALNADRVRVTERLDNLAKGCIQTNTRLDKWIKDFRNRVDVMQLESVGVSVPDSELNAEEVSI